MLHKWSLAAGVALASIMPALAHAETPAASAQASSGLGEIVVTAEKRESTASKTPIAMTVASGADLIRAGVADVNGLSNIAPTLNIAQNNQNTMITIRGISSRDYTETGNPAVAVSIDNFFLQNGTALNVGFYDLDRVEVLRGPQGTLYGRNASAGAINIQTAKPTKKLEGSVSLGYGYKNALLVEGMINLPVTDNLQVRAAFSVHNRDGYRNNGSLSTGNENVSKGGNDDVSQSARLHVMWEPTSNFTALVTGEYTHVGGVGPVIKGILADQVNGDGTLKIGSTTNWQLSNQSYIDITQKTIRGTLTYDLGFAKLTYIGGYRQQHILHGNDQDGGTTYSYAFPTDGKTDTENHELRIASNGNTRFGWQGGLYYFQDGGQALTYFQVLGNPVYNYYTFNYLTNAQSFAAYGQVYYKIFDNLKLSGGARYTEEYKNQLGYSIIAGTYTDVNWKYHGGKDTYHVGLDWQVDPHHLVYAKFDTGFKTGGVQNLRSYGPESIKAYEVGAKNRLFGNTVELNIDAFYYDYSQLQVQQNDPETAISYIYNAGKARDYGVEFEGRWAITPNDRLDANINYVNARYTDFVNTGVQYAGHALPQSPNWALGGGFSHDFELKTGAKVTARVQTRYESKSYFGFENANYELQKAYTKTDLILSYTPLGKGFSASAFIYNLENSTILTDSEAAGYAGGYLVQFADPRTYGVRLNYSF